MIYHVDYFSENGKGENNQNNYPKMRSAYHTISVNGVLDHNIQYYLKALEQGPEQHIKYAGILRFNYENNITHDGKPKPRKEDVFQRAKKHIRSKVQSMKARRYSENEGTSVSG